MSPKMIFAFAVGTSLFVSSEQPRYSTTAAVVLAGAKVASSQQDTIIEKYKRKDCPVCKGKGWYMSGDGIKKIDCQYCEPETKTQEDVTNIIYN